MTKIAFTFLKEMLLMFVRKIAWKHIAERFFSRLLVYSLNKIKTYTDNDVAKETVDDIIESLKGKRLKVIDKLAVPK